MPLVDARTLPSEGEAREVACAQALERGSVLFFATTPFQIPPPDRELLLEQRLAEAGYHKNIAYRPGSDRVTGVARSRREDSERLRRVLRDYSRRVIAFVSDLFPRYSRRWRIDYTSFRPQEEAGRRLSTHSRNDLLHVDSFPTRPTGGDRIFRVFTNVNPSAPRVWRTGENFEELAGRFAESSGLLARVTRPRPLARLARIARSAGLPVRARSAYDEFMLGFHHFMKENSAYQQTARAEQMEFPPGSTWMVFTDAVAHSVLSGQFAVEQTFLIPPDAMLLPETAPVAVLETIARRKMTDDRQRIALRKTLPLFLAASLGALAATAQTPFVGPRASAMGGAATAVADDGTALWTNPAGLARDLRVDIELFGSAVATNRNEFTTAIDRLSGIDPLHPQPGDLATAIRELQRIAEPGTGIVGSGVAGLVFGKSGIAIGIGDVGFAGVYPTVDLVHVLPGSDPATAFSRNTSGLSFAGLEARDARVAYSRSFFGRVLLIGGTLRYIQGRTYFVRQSAFQEGETDPWTLARRAFRRNRVDTDRFAFDAGAMVNILGKARVGLVSTAINEPKFRVANDPADPTLSGAPAVFRLPRTLRAGVALQPVGMLTLAADYDLRSTPTLVPDARSRQFSFGIEGRLPLFAIRGGVFRDTSAVDPHWAYSAGVGIGLNMISVNASVVFSSEGGLSLSSTNRRDLGTAVDARVRF